ncbi:hypothetical protein [Bhargavaea beijingensis]|uniref:Short-chain dehydrogenase n=1 Tax=Bhargavaea beijingensis TaxID=426756 RepID=A0A1G7BM58_9BACL|nr:hypothetical protein [Bhargavaea beijingensis]MCW1926772.1 hypothetical protein [Bhargavaea beijingensis]SDE28033.1 hypothetical protein SAMN04488126_10635 [Bhargavaea beijingensis]
MEMWLWPTILVSLLTIAIGLASIRKMDRTVAKAENGEDQISEEVGDHPFTLNPILIIIAVAMVFLGFVIFYYAVAY